MSFVMSVRPRGTYRLPLKGLSRNLIFDDFSENLPRKFTFHENLTHIKGTLHEDLCTFMIVSC
jgi:hypothetical protein